MEGVWRERFRTSGPRGREVSSPAQRSRGRSAANAWTGPWRAKADCLLGITSVLPCTGRSTRGFPHAGALEAVIWGRDLLKLAHCRTAACLLVSYRTLATGPYAWNQYFAPRTSLLLWTLATLHFIKVRGFPTSFLQRRAEQRRVFALPCVHPRAGRQCIALTKRKACRASLLWAKRRRGGAVWSNLTSTKAVESKTKLKLNH